MAKKHHKTLFGQIFGSIWDFIKAPFENANHNLLEILVTVTNKVKDALNSGAVDFLTSVIPTDIDDKLVALIRGKLPKIVATEILLKSFDDTDMTEEESKETAQKILDVWGGLNDADKAEFYTTLGSKLYIFIQEHQHGEKVTFGEAAAFIESAWKAWQKSQEKKADEDKF